jgi:hypothetical protein
VAASQGLSQIEKSLITTDTLVIFMGGQVGYLTPCGGSQSIYGSIEKWLSEKCYLCFFK